MSFMVIHLFPFETINVVFCSSVHLLSSSVIVCYFLFFLCFENVALIDQRSLCSTRLLDFYSLHCQWNLFTSCQIWFLEVVGTQWRLSLKFSNVQYLLCILLPMSFTECSITIICNGESPGLVVMEGDSCPKVVGSNPGTVFGWMDIFSHIFVVKIAMMLVWKVWK